MNVSCHAINRAERLGHIKLASVVVSLSVLFTSFPKLCAASRADVRREARAALNHLYSISPAARPLGKSAKALLVFPSIVKAGPIGAQQGYGALFVHDRAIGYYKLITASCSVPKRVQKFGFVLFFMSDDDFASLRNSGIWEIGKDPGVVLGQETQKQTQRTICTSANASANQVITMAPSAAEIVAHASQITHRETMNDQQEPAPRPNGLTLDSTYRGFIPISNTGFTKTLTATMQRDGVYAFAFCRKGLIDGLRLQGTKITAVHPD
jgi:lipid-binding SYLF domain-containing protein